MSVEKCNVSNVKCKCGRELNNAAEHFDSQPCPKLLTSTCFIPPHLFDMQRYSTLYILRTMALKTRLRGMRAIFLVGGRNDIFVNNTRSIQSKPKVQSNEFKSASSFLEFRGEAILCSTIQFEVRSASSWMAFLGERLSSNIIPNLPKTKSRGCMP